jgi:hypothetical protein
MKTFDLIPSLGKLFFKLLPHRRAGMTTLKPVLINLNPILPVITLITLRWTMSDIS